MLSNLCRFISRVAVIFVLATGAALFPSFLPTEWSNGGSVAYAKVRLNCDLPTVGDDRQTDWLTLYGVKKADYKKIKWSCSPKGRLKLDPWENYCDFTTIPGKTGKATVTAKYQGKSYKKTITVKKTSINKTKMTLYVGDSGQLKIKNTFQDYIWASSDAHVASVDSKGEVTAHKTGKITITATYNPFTEPIVKYKCAVTVVEKPEPPTEGSGSNEGSAVEPSLPETIAESLSINPSSVEILEGETRNVTVYFTTKTPSNRLTASYPSSLVETEWIGSWKKTGDAWYKTLSVTGLSGGYGTIKVYDKANNSLSAQLSVRVAGSSTTGGSSTTDSSSTNYILKTSEVSSIVGRYAVTSTLLPGQTSPKKIVSKSAAFSITPTDTKWTTWWNANSNGASFVQLFKIKRESGDSDDLLLVKYKVYNITKNSTEIIDSGYCSLKSSYLNPGESTELRVTFNMPVSCIGDQVKLVFSL